MLANAYITVVIGILCAKALGFVRDVVFASSFGTSIEADIYFQIFGVANLVFTGIGVALSTLIIKNINKSDSNNNGREYVSFFITKMSLLIIGATVLLYILARPITHLLLPQISSENFELAVNLMYIMLPSFLFVCVAYMISGALQNRQVFFIPSIMSMPYNAVMIAVLLFGETDILRIGMFTTFGWFLHIVVQLPSFYRQKYHLLSHSFSSAQETNIKRTAETVCIFISGMMFQFCFIIDKAFVSYDEGLISTITYASNLFITISGVFVVAMSSVVFPAISQNYEHGEREYVRRLVSYVIIIMFSIFVPFLLVVTFFGYDIISLIYERGKFTAESTAATAPAFIIYCFGIFGYLAQNLLAKVLYLASRYRHTVVATIIVTTLKVLLDCFLIPIYGVNAAALTTTLLLTFYAVFIGYSVRHVVGNSFDSPTLKVLGKVLLCAAISVGALFVFRALLPDFTGLGKAAFVVPLLLCGAVYILSAVFTGVVSALQKNPLAK
ncbi:MAG: oligosaccharide flippase family protein [Clostridia bacterium]|nr:oligosaccharide flippase family protein [Clostridia bacterium]